MWTTLTSNKFVVHDSVFTSGTGTELKKKKKKFGLLKYLEPEPKMEL